LVSLAVIVNLIGSTTTTAGLRVRSEIDHRTYPAGTVVTDEQMAQVQLEPHGFHGDWKYTIRPAKSEVRTDRSKYFLLNPVGLPKSWLV